MKKKNWGNSVNIAMYNVFVYLASFLRAVSLEYLDNVSICVHGSIRQDI